MKANLLVPLSATLMLALTSPACRRAPSAEHGVGGVVAYDDGSEATPAEGDESARLHPEPPIDPPAPPPRMFMESVTVTGGIVDGGTVGNNVGGFAKVIGGVPGGVLGGVPGGIAAPSLGDAVRRSRLDEAGESYALIRDNPFTGALAEPLSTFSVDVDSASYSNVRRFVTGGGRPPVDAVRIEELVNYFTFDDPEPRGREPVAVTTELAPAPWKTDHLLLRIGVKARAIDTSELPPCNLVFLVDVSGSMNAPDKLPLLQQAFALLVNELRSADRVTLVVYAGAAGLVLPPTPGDRKDLILDAIQRLQAGGSTAGGEGLRLAYDEAQRSRIPGGVNRVILATDGDFNVGESSDSEMIRLIETKRKEGTFLTVLGFGEGNLQDSKMEGIADHGNGHYAYVDSLLEARKVLVEELGGTLATVAKDVKIQVEFNPARVAAYRLIGYENRMLDTEDFADDRKDAGDMGAGHSVTAFYELIPAGSADAERVAAPAALRYAPGTDATHDPAERAGELLLVKLRWKEPEGDTSRLLERPVLASATVESPSCEFAFAASVAEFGMILRASEHRGEASLERVLASAGRCTGRDPHGDRAGFLSLVRSYGEISPEGEETERTAAAN